MIREMIPPDRIPTRTQAQIIDALAKLPVPLLIFPNAGKYDWCVLETNGVAPTFASALTDVIAALVDHYQQAHQEERRVSRELLKRV